MAVARMSVLDKVADLRRLLAGEALPPLASSTTAVQATSGAPSAPPRSGSTPVRPSSPGREPESGSRSAPSRGPNLQQAVEADPVLGRIVDAFDATPTSE
jgi:hypothetical protein